MPPVLSLLDLAVVGREQTVQEGLAGTVALAQAAERCGYERVWYAEHHNNPSIASSATSVLIAHVAAHTKSIRLGAGGVMLPNHAPLIIAEQYGTLASLHPGRIDLGLGRAPGTDPTTMRALRRDARAADTFPDDVAELGAYLRGESLLPGVNAYPGKGTDVPLYILGSSLFGAKLAAAMGLPYAFASHFAPAALADAVAAYRSEFRPSEQLAEPYVIAGVGAIATDTGEEAAAQLLTAQRRRVQLLLPPGRTLTDEEADAVLASPQGRQITDMMRYTAVGTAGEVGTYLTEFAEHARADELIIALHADQVDQRVRAAEIIAGAMAG
ncbi:MAG TPA: LLM class flavin-dependent oxidoreductase [Ruania sp.]|nr:LLM class flavin-dependent oxidoreductase [Ruania sp.]